MKVKRDDGSENDVYWFNHPVSITVITLVVVAIILAVRHLTH